MNWCLNVACFSYVTFEIISINVPICINVIHINIFKLSHHECYGFNFKFVTKGKA